MIAKILLFSAGVLVGALLLIVYDCRRAENVDRLPVRIVNSSGKPCIVHGAAADADWQPTMHRIKAGETTTIYPWRTPISVVQTLLLLEIEVEGKRMVFELSPEDLAAVTDDTMPLTLELRPDMTFVSTQGSVYPNGILNRPER